MAFLQCDFHSDVLEKACSMRVVIPQKSNSLIGMKTVGEQKNYPVLYLLHGLSDDDSIWSRRTSIERYAAEYPLVVVMPNGDRSFYMNMADGPRYNDFLCQELPEIVRSMFPVSSEREDTFIAGLSMGGFGALKSALKYPERYAAAAGLSSVIDAAFLFKNPTPEFRRVFGSAEQFHNSDDDPYFTSANPRGKQLPRLLQICGTEDFLYADNIRFRDHIRSLNLYDYEYIEAPGCHSWEFWDVHIREVLKWLMKGRRLK